MNSGWTLLIECDVDHRPDETHLDENIKFVKVVDFVSPASSITIPLQQNDDSKLLLAKSESNQFEIQSLIFFGFRLKSTKRIKFSKIKTNFSSKSGSGEPPARNKSRAERTDAVAKNLQNPVHFFQRQKMKTAKILRRTFAPVEAVLKPLLEIFCKIFLACH
jgi:hypothetical protein